MFAFLIYYSNQFGWHCEASRKGCLPPSHLRRGRNKAGTGNLMKTIIVLSILLCAIAMPAIGELSDAGLDKIRLIVKDEVNSEITASEERMKTYVDTKVDGLKTLITWLIGILVAIIAVIGLPLAILTIFFRQAECDGYLISAAD